MIKNDSKKAGSKGSKGKEPWYFNWLSKNIYLAVAAIIVLLFIISQLLDVVTRHNKELDVPSFVGLSVGEAESMASQYNLRVDVTDSVHNSRLQPGTVVKQNPAIGSKVKKQRRILITINCKSPKMVPMPSLEGYSLRQAQTELDAAQLKIGKLVYVEDIATNNVIKQLHKGKRIKPGELIPAESVIDLEVGMNKEDDVTYIPNLMGVTYEELGSIISEKALNLSKAVFDKNIKTYDDSLDAVVYKQEPEPSQNVPVKIGTDITVYLTKSEN